jgi:hypothetical protein
MIAGARGGFTAFAAGYVVGGSEFATQVNPGLVQALDSVGKNLFGSAVFGVFLPQEPAVPTDPWRIDIAENTQIPVALSVFVPPNPIIPNDTCHAYLKVELSGGAALVKYDPFFAPDGFQMQAADLSAIVPNTSQCPAPLPTGD